MKKVAPIVGLLITAVLFTGTAQAQTPNLLINGSFEDPIGTEWTPVGAVVGPIEWRNPPDGDYIVLMKGGQRLTGLTQQVTGGTGSAGDTVTLNYAAGASNNIEVPNFVGVRVTLLNGTTVVDRATCLPLQGGTVVAVEQTCVIASASGAYDTIEVGIGGFQVDGTFFGFDDVSLIVE